MPLPALDDTLAALSDPTRRRVVDLLRKKARRASELADELETTRPTMSKHLRVLRASGLVEETSPENDARVRVYRLRRAPFASLRRWIEDVEAFWSLELDAFKEHVEARARQEREEGKR
jgi:DNA-binding transcriptional ArsR family regulator